MRLWIAMTLSAAALAAGTWWLTRSTEPETSTASEKSVRSTVPDPPPWPEVWATSPAKPRYRIRVPDRKRADRGRPGSGP